VLCMVSLVASTMRILNHVRNFRPAIHPVWLSTIVAIAFVLIYNAKLWGMVLKGWPGRGFLDWLFICSFGIVLTIAFALVLQPFAFRKLIKPTAIFLVMTASLVTYFSGTYGVIFDKMMIANVLDTDPREVANLLSLKLVLQLVFFGVVPALVISRLTLRTYSKKQEIALRLGMVGTGLLVIAVIAAAFFQDYASFVRNNRQIRYSINPTSAIYYTAGYAIRHLVPKDETIAIVAETVHPGAALSNDDKPVVFVLVIGETARASNFSLNGYERDTNPLLSALPILNFTNFWSCGTSTAESLPCMLSPFSRGEQSLEVMSYSENLLDILARADFDVVWIENNSGGCKGTCRPQQRLFMGNPADPGVCAAGECKDEILLQRLEEKLETVSRNTIYVLHQMGSHGPTYYQQYPDAYRQFTPTCDTNQLQTCATENIVNTYDNTILYTDEILSEAIGALASVADHVDVSLMYVSDHGESLGENGIYLHGFPFAIAPDEQKHVPFLMWMSEAFENHLSLDRSCISAQQNVALSHDNLFHTIIGMLNVETNIYRGELDFLSNCETSVSDSETSETIEQSVQ